ncbi:MAG: arginine deiminase family protein [Spirochaetes bacterium]|nr:arginine deiminase family protein [Spirochaetota bacterium]
MGKLSIYSEIGRLKRVIIHSPGSEVEAMTPEEAERDLYNDIIPLDSVLKEYGRLKDFLSRVSEVYELVYLLSECLGDTGNKYEFLGDLSRCIPIGPAMESLMALPAPELASLIVKGIPAPEHSLSRLLDEQSYLSRPLPNTYFMRDSAAVVGDALVSAATAYDVRMVEAIITRFIFTHHKEFLASGLLLDGPGERNRYLTAEGGDLIVISPDVLAVGVSERTTPYAVERIARNAVRLFGRKICIFVVDLPKTRATIHLDMVFTVIDRDAALVYGPAIIGPSRSSVCRIDMGENGKMKFGEVNSLLKGLEQLGIELEPVLCGNGLRLHQEREQWLSGANSFAFAPGKILTYSCNRYTAEALSAAGFEIVDSDRFITGKETVETYGRLAVTFDGIELARGGGGARCMTLPVERDPI